MQWLTWQEDTWWCTTQYRNFTLCILLLQLLSVSWKPDWVSLKKTLPWQMALVPWQSEHLLKPNGHAPKIMCQISRILGLRSDRQTNSDVFPTNWSFDQSHPIISELIWLVKGTIIGEKKSELGCLPKHSLRLCCETQRQQLFRDRRWDTSDMRLCHPQCAACNFDLTQHAR